jgi:hypothetical protein|tara:strand:- start:17707 stop:18837 length:1131 start_codon:yes stop_codon:yes gene_type:complete
MKSFKKFAEAKDEYCSDKCCGSDVKAEDCKCPPDCAHCNCNSVSENLEEYTNWSVRHPTKPTKSYKVKARNTGEALKKAHKAAVKAGDLHKQAPHDSMLYKHVKKEEVSPAPTAAERDAKRAGVGRTGETARERANRLGKSQRESVEETEQLDELSPATLKSYKKKAMKQYKQSANKRMPGGGDYGSATKKAQDKHQKRFDKRHKGIGSEIKRTTDSDIHLKDPKGLVRKNPKANSLSGKPAPYKYKAESLSEEQVNQITAQYINENNISMAELEAMSPEQLDEFIGKAVGGAFKLGAKAAVGTARLAGKGIKKAANRMSTAGRADAAEKKAKSIEQKQKDRERMQAAKQRVRDLKQKQAEAKRKQNQQQNKPKPA